MTYYIPEKTIISGSLLLGSGINPDIILSENLTLYPTTIFNNNSGNIITPNYKKVIPNMGMKRETHVGNLIIDFTITFPEKLSEEQISALEKIL